MEEVSTPGSEVQLSNVQMTVIASILIGLFMVITAVLVWKKLSIKGETGEPLPEVLES
jgi:hypothetical protein